MQITGRYLYNNKEMPETKTGARYEATVMPRVGSFGKVEIRDEMNLLVVSGQMNASGLQGEITTFFDGEIIMKVTYENNEKHGKCVIYRDRTVVFNGTYIHGVRYGQAEEMDPLTKQTVYAEYDGFGNKQYEISNDEGVRKIKHLSNGVVDGEGSYRIASHGDSIHFVPEGYYCSKENDKYTLVYYPLSTSTTNPPALPLRENDCDYLTIFSYPTSRQQVLYEAVLDAEPQHSEGFYAPALEMQRSKGGKELFYASVTAAEPFLALYCDCTKDTVNGEAQFIEADCTCVCTAEFEDNVVSEITMFDREFETTFEGLFSDWSRVVRVNATRPLDALAYTEVSELIIADNLLLKAEVFDVSRFVFVRRIVVGKFSFGDVKRAYFWHLPMLESIVVDDGAFCARRTAGNEYVGTVSTLPEEAAEGSVLYIGCCNQLKEVTIGTNCFTEFTTLRVEGLGGWRI